ncbi:HAD-IIIA family hydrolase [Paenibacillus sp. KQZ6P-2]|uniref:D,D-heptose 1,7-bisphosphate phosphatase n=1 Tax=Paenibacillus mangrovi TaxID=2931978 RepID=A0A9X1WLB4_9BACL|nr:HAD-IIIA family hydrolase [Paenibacillus mangrovi]
MKQIVEAVFIDRDGTIGGYGHFIHPNEFEIFPNALLAIQLLKKNNIKVFAFTNQYRISRGQATLDEFEEQFREYGFDQSYICPHELDDHCDCRKPKAGMLLRASIEHKLDLTKCVVIGDVGDTDMLAAHRVGAKKILVKTGWGEGSLGEFRDKWIETEPDFIAGDILEAVEWIIDSSMRTT